MPAGVRATASGVAGIAARVGADEAMIFVLSWNENTNLGALQSMRAGSKWTTDPELVQRRWERAYSFIRYAPIHHFVEGPVYSDDEEEVSTDGEEVDEEIEADTPPDTATGTATETATAVATETQIAPSAPSTSGAAI